MKNKLFFLMSLLFAVTASFAAFGNDHFNFGRQWKNTFNGNTDFKGKGLSHLAIWVGDNDTYNQYWEGDMVAAAVKNGLTPVFYAYVIAEYDKDQGYEDCDVRPDGSNHCTHGAQTIRLGWNNILSRYRSYAQGVAKTMKDSVGSEQTSVWLIEPDFFQYSAFGDSLNQKYAQQGGGIPDDSLCGYYFDEIVSTIKAALPKAKIAVDISPWINDGIKTWYSHFDKSKVDYLFTSGGRTQGNQSRIRNDENNLLTWKAASDAMGGKRIIADDGYGVGGGGNDDYKEWLDINALSSRIQDKVIGLTIQDPDDSYYEFASKNIISISSSNQEDLKLVVELKTAITSTNQAVTAGDSIWSIVYKCENFTSLEPSGFPSGVSGAYDESAKTYTISGTVNASLTDSVYTYKLAFTGLDSAVEVSGKITVFRKIVKTTLQWVSGPREQTVTVGDDITPVIFAYTHMKSIRFDRTIGDEPVVDQDNQMVTISGNVNALYREGSYYVAVIVEGTDNTVTDTVKINVKRKVVHPTITLASGSDVQTVMAGETIQPIVYRYENVTGIAISVEPRGISVNCEKGPYDKGTDGYCTISGTLDESLKDSIHTYKITVMLGGDEKAEVTGTITVKHKPVTTTVEVVENAEQTVTAGDAIKPIVFKYAHKDSVKVTGLPQGSLKLSDDKENQTETISGKVLSTLPDGEYTISLIVYGSDNSATATAKIIVKHKPVKTTVTVVENAEQTVTAGDDIKPIVFKYAHKDSVKVTGLPQGDLKLSDDKGNLTETISGTVLSTLPDGEYTISMIVYGSDNSATATAKIIVKHKPVATTVKLVSDNAEQTVPPGDSIEPIVFKYANMDSVKVEGLLEGLTMLRDSENQTVTVSGMTNKNQRDIERVITIYVYGPDNTDSASVTVTVKRKARPLVFELVSGHNEQTVTAGDSIEPIVYHYENTGAFVIANNLPLGFFKDDKDAKTITVCGVIPDTVGDYVYEYSAKANGIDAEITMEEIILTGKITVKRKTTASSSSVASSSSAKSSSSSVSSSSSSVARSSSSSARSSSSVSSSNSSLASSSSVASSSAASSSSAKSSSSVASSSSVESSSSSEKLIESSSSEALSSSSEAQSSSSEPRTYAMVPVSNSISLSVEGRSLHLSGSETMRLDVFDMQGFLVTSFKQVKGTVSLDMLRQGSYIVRVHSGSNNLIRLINIR